MSLRFAVVGAGAIGGFLGARLASAGERVTLIARGAHLEAMRERGVAVRSAEGDFTVRATCTDELAAVRDADVVLLTLKANALPELAPRLAPLLAPEAVVVTAQNGIPWWYFERHGGPLEGTRLRSVDPEGAIARHIDVARVVGCVVYPAAELLAPGVIWHVEGTRFPVGEPDGTRSERSARIAAALTRAGLKAPVRARIRDDIWLKLVGNAALNSVSALTRATLHEVGEDPGARATARALAEEAARVAAALGVRLEIGVERRLEAGFRIRGHKPSTLHDLESGRPLELDALVGAVIEIADRVRVEVPRLRTVYACLRLLERTLHARERAAAPAEVAASGDGAGRSPSPASPLSG